MVAKEIRKLSKETVESTEKISNTLFDMRQSIEEMKSLVGNIVTVGKNQALSTEEVSSFIDEIEVMSKELTRYAKEI